MKRIGVTGAAGFIGSNLVRALLEANYEVLSVDNLSAGTLENLPAGSDFRQVDILDPDFSKHLAGVDVLFHLAAKNCLADCAASPVDTARINVAGTASVLQAALEQGVRHVVYADTSAEYEGVLDFPSQTDRVKPLSIYACSKRGGALMCEAFQGLHPIKITTLRYFNVYGPAQDWRRVIPPVMSAFTIKLLSGESPTIYGTGEKRRDFIHVDDVNAFHLKLIEESEFWGGTYNLGSGKDYSILEIFSKIESVLQSGIPPRFLAELPAEAQRTLADTSGTLKTGWSPKVSLEEGIHRFISYTRSRLSAEPIIAGLPNNG